MPPPVRVSSHPLVRHKLARLRHRDTRPPEFRGLVYEIAQVLFYEATADVPVRPVSVPTPMADAPAEELGVRVGLVPVLRAGLGMADALLDALPLNQEDQRLRLAKAARIVQLTQARNATARASHAKARSRALLAGRIRVESLRCCIPP